MAIPGTPQNLQVQTANQQILISWNLSPGATTYVLQRSLDNVTFATIATITGSPLATSYIDSAITLGVQYWYKVLAQTVDGDSPYTNPQAMTAAPQGEMALSAIRLSSRQSADRVNSNFVTDVEWNNFIRMACYELYDLLITVYEDLYVARPIQFVTTGSQQAYDLPNGSNQFYYADDLNGGLITPPSFYKLLGVDLQVQNVNNGYVTVNKFNFIDRNTYVYPNSSSTIYGVFNCQYRVMGKKINFIPTPSANQGIRLWYIPRLQEMLQDTDTSDISISGWIRYVIVRAAKYALDKEESDSSKQDAELMFLKGRIEETAANRDAGQPDRISDTRATRGYWGSSGGWGGSSNGGF